ncbi:hypothetical protein EPYR_02910 [Erwinia pyrifoliae DSM 12163]|nr:hypothetical protein EPYR_02910 [Erwinia pyrifoliae DSM 12163]
MHQGGILSCVNKKEFNRNGYGGNRQRENPLKDIGILLVVILLSVLGAIIGALLAI